MKHIVSQQVAFNLWANTRVAEVLKNVDPAFLDKEIPSSFSSIRKTVFHIWNAETVWLKRLQGQPIGAVPGDVADSTTPVDAFLQTSLAFNNFIDQQSEEFLKSPCTFKLLSGEETRQDNYSLIMHCVDHSGFHRGQIYALLRILGYQGKLPMVGMIAWLRENP